jgi:hypothetical protein
MKKSYKNHALNPLLLLILTACGGGESTVEHTQQDRGVIESKLQPIIGSRPGSFDFDQYKIRNAATSAPDPISVNSAENVCPRNGDLTGINPLPAASWVSCDFWWKSYFTFGGRLATHTGGDFQVGPNSNHVPILTFGYGKVHSSENATGRVSVRHLLDSGEEIFANYMHMEQKAAFGGDIRIGNSTA